MALDYSKEVNFTEATSNAYQVFQSSDLPYNVQDIFDAPQTDDVQEKGEFWVCCTALKKFQAEHKRLPVSGSIPDMTSYTDYYLQL